MQTLAFTAIGNVAILFETEESHPDAEWEAWIAFITTRMHHYPDLCMLGYSLGGTPSPIQRKRSLDVMPRKDLKCSVMSNSILVRGATTVYGWFGVSIRAFKLSEFESALLYLGIPVEKHNLFREAIDALRHETERG